MTNDELYAALALAALRKKPSDASGLALMLVLHIYAIVLKPNVKLEDVTSSHATVPIVLPAITQRHAASVVAALCGTVAERGRYEYWYSEYQMKCPYEVHSDIPPTWLGRMHPLLEKLQRSPFIDRLVVDG